MIDDNAMNDIASRHQKILDDLTGANSKLLSKQEQLQRYQKLTGNTAWIDTALAQAQHPAHKELLQTIQRHGYKGLADYVHAMERLKGGS